MRKMTNNEVLALVDEISGKLETLRVAISGQVTEGEMLAVRASEKGVCTYCGEKIVAGEKHFRGAHERCYKKVNRAINSGELTDIQAVERGYVLPASAGGRKLDESDPLAQFRKEKRR